VIDDSQSNRTRRADDSVGVSRSSKTLHRFTWPCSGLKSVNTR
jgi:hypothetical protein